MNQPSRGQLAYPLDNASKGALRLALEDVEKDVIRKRNRVQLTISGTSFTVASDYMVLSAGSAVTIATIVGGREGQILTIEFADGNITMTDDSTGAVNTLNLSATFMGSANDTLQILHNGTSWKEISRSAN